MLNEFDKAIIAFGRQLLHKLPFANTHIEGFAVGEMAWTIAAVVIAGQLYLMLNKKKVMK
jgi:hypothetical protein